MSAKIQWAFLCAAVILGAISPAGAADRLTTHPNAAEAKTLMGMEPSREMIHSGRVTEVHATPNYVYILAVGDKASTWLAAPHQAIAVGSNVRWGNGVEMRDFQSKQLNRLFHSIVFVDRVEVGKN